MQSKNISLLSIQYKHGIDKWQGENKKILQILISYIGSRLGKKDWG